MASARLILPATSFGGVESTWERRARWPGESAPGGLIRLSVGVEPAADLIADIDDALGHAGGAVTRMSAGDYELDDDPRRIDADAAVAFLTTQAYWGRWRGARGHQAARSPRPGGLWASTTGPGPWSGSPGPGATAANAYLSDVYVLPEHRGAGLGQAIVRMMIDDGPGAGWRWMLHTSDAHGLYRQFGFDAPSYRYLERPAQDEAAAPMHEAAAGTLVGKLVRLEPLRPPARAGAGRRDSRGRGTVPLVRGAAGRGPGPQGRRDGDRGPGRRNGRAVRGGPHR